MYINEVLQLDKVSGSIKKIDLFLAGCNKKSLEYYKAYCYRNLVLHEIGKTNEALKSLYGMVIDFAKMEDDAVISVCDAIISITMDVHRLDEASKYIQIKKHHLRVSNAILNTIDEIHLSMAKKEYSSAILGLNAYLADDITRDDMIWGYEQLAKIYYEIHEPAKFLDITNRLEKIYSESLNTNKLIEIYSIRLKLAYEAGNHVKVICDANRLLNEYDLPKEIKIKTVTLLMDCYLKSKDYRKAAIMESNYEEELKEVSSNTALEFSKVSLELYKQTNSLVSIKHYQDKINEYSQEKKKENHKKKQNKNAIIIPKIKEEQAESEPVYKPQEQIQVVAKDIPLVYVSNMYIKLEKIYSIINQLEGTTKFREILRLTCIELTKLISFEEAYFLYYDQQYAGFQYKKERVYDKKLLFEDIENTLNQAAISLEQEIYLSPDSSEYTKNIVDSAPYLTIPNGIAFPLWKEDNVYGSLAFFSSTPFLQEPMVYETLRLISQMLNRSFILELEQNEVRSANKKMFFLYENMSSGVKEIVDENIHLSYQAKEMLGSLEDTTLHEYSLHIHPEDLPIYTSTLEEVFKTLNSKTISYRYKKGAEYIHIKESIFPSFENGMILIYSLVENISSEIKIRDELMNLAYMNPTTKLFTELKLTVDLNELSNHRKLSLAVFEVYDFKLYEELYGINFSNQLIYAIAKTLKEVFINQFNVLSYHLEKERFAVVILDCNDKRTVDHILLEAFTKISTQIHDKNHRVSLLFRCGVYRVSKSATQLDSNKIIQYAYDALTLAKDNLLLSNQIKHYDSEEAKLKFNENSLITHISEAIDHNRIGVCYKQIVDITEGEVFAFDAYLSLDNYDIDASYVKQVIARRGLEEVLNKYLISNASKDLKMLKTTAKGELAILVDVHPKTIQQNFVSFLETQNTFYKTTKRNIIFFVSDTQSKQIEAAHLLGYQFASEDVFDIYKGIISYYVYDISKGFEVLKEIISLCKEKKVCLIVSNVKEKEELQKLKDMGIQYLYGPYYKKTIRMKKVIEKLS